MFAFFENEFDFEKGSGWKQADLENKIRQLMDIYVIISQCLIQ
jgi:hypothetical protein